MLDNYFNLDESSFVGYITELTYNNATIMSHDFHVSKANFVPKGAFLLVKVEDENTKLPFAYFLIRVLDISYIDHENKINKEMTIQKITAPNSNIIDFQKEINDPINQNKLSFYQLNCNMLGTFYENNDQIHFGSDVYSFNVGHIYKVYKPIGNNLEKIVNFVKEDRLKATHDLFQKISGKPHNNDDFKFNIGRTRYASTLIENSQSENTDIANVTIYPSDFIKQKTGVFGMTRTGKSNTVKILVKSIMDLSKELSIPIGQLIYDINGEYANDNEQNKRLIQNHLYTVDVEGLNEKHAQSHYNFKPALNNFYLNPNYGLNIIQKGVNNQDKGSNYLNVFLSIKDVESDPLLFILWILLLCKSGYEFPDIGKDDELKSNNDKYYYEINSNIFYYINQQSFYIKIDSEKYKNNENFLHQFLQKNDHKNTTLIITQERLKSCLKNYLKIEFKKENDKSVVKEHSLYHLIRQSGLEHELHYFSLIGFILQEDRTSGGRYNISGWQMIVPYQYSHCKRAIKDYRKTIYDNLKNGETVIIDFSIGDPFTRKYIADELMTYIFEEQIKAFRQHHQTTIQNCSIINIFIEEAHNVIGKGTSIDSLWPRIAKEGAKYNIGLVYATQEPSAIHESILANTANFVIAHLNNEKEINTISQYEDIGDFKESIKRSEDVGFVRLRLLSKPYTVPVQIKKFE